MKTFLFTFLCVSILIKSSFQTHPRYSYVCNEDGSVEFTGFKANSTVTFEGTCDAGLHVTANRNDQVVTIPSSCMGTDLTTVRTFTVKVKDENLKEKAATPSPKQSNITGGLESHTFVLTCTAISTVNRTVLRQFHLQDKETILPKQNEIGQVDMRFKADDNIKLPDISEVYIGDKFYMFLQYKGVSDYIIEPQMCTAFEGNDIYDPLKRKEALWDITGKASQKCVAKTAKALGLLGTGGFKYENKSTVRTRMNGFRFNNAETDITIFCRVLLELPTTRTADKDTQVCSTSRRRKRSSHSNDKKHLDVMHTLLVKDRGIQGSSLAQRTVAQVITVTASLFIIRILQKLVF